MDLRRSRTSSKTGYTIVDGKHKLRKTCPGLSVYMKGFRVEVCKEMQRTLGRADCYDGEIDGQWGPLSRQAMSQYQYNENGGV